MGVAGVGVAGAIRMSQSASNAAMLAWAMARTRWAWKIQAAGSSAPASSRSCVKGSNSSSRVRSSGRRKPAPSLEVMRKAAARTASASAHSTVARAFSTRPTAATALRAARVCGPSNQPPSVAIRRPERPPFIPAATRSTGMSICAGSAASGPCNTSYTAASVPTSRANGPTWSSAATNKVAPVRGSRP